MKRIGLILITLLIGQLSFSQDSYLEATIDGEADLTVLVEDMYPYAYYSKDSLTGIEVDILNAFADWLETRQNIKLNLKFKSYSAFNELYDDVINNQNMVGAASITINKKRKEDIQFTPPYMNNNTVLVSNNGVPSIKSYSEIKTVFKDKIALVIEGTTFEKELQEIKAFHYPELRVKYIKNTDEMLPLLRNEEKYFTVMDFITFWDYVKNDNEPLKVHRVATGKKEEFGFILPKNCDWSKPFNEFFTAGFGFTASEDYYNIMKKHLGEEVMEKVVRN